MAKRFAIRVTFGNGKEALLRRGARPGEGPVVAFSSRKLADINAEMVGLGLDGKDVVTVIEWRTDSGRRGQRR